MGMIKGYKQTKEHIEKRAKAKRKGRYFNCLICEKEFWRCPANIINGNNKFCSKDCYFIWQRGKPKVILKKIDKRKEKNPNWRGGITKISFQIRASDEYKEWREKVFKRDDWTCQKCGNRSSKNNYLRIEAHHIKPFALFPECRFLIDNGLTLCKKCHDKEPKGKEIWNFH